NPVIAVAWLTAAFLLFFLWTPWWVRIKARPPRVADFLTTAAAGMAYFVAAFGLLDPLYHQWMGLFTAAIGGLHLLLAFSLRKTEAAPHGEKWAALLTGGLALAFVTISVPIQFTGFRITIAWAVEGAAVAWIASRLRSVGTGIGAAL